MRTKELVVEVDGRSLAAAELQLLSEIRIQQKLSLPTLCELAFLVGPNSDLYRRMEIGATTRVRVATPASSGLLFEGDITGREHVYNADQGPQLRLRAYDRLHRLRKHQKAACYVQVTLRKLATQLLRGAEVKASVTAASAVPALKWRRLIQGGQTNFDFLLEQCAACGIFFTLRGDKLHLLTLQGMGNRVPLVLGSSLVEATFEINGNQSSRRCNATSWDPRRAEAHAAAASRPRVGRNVKAEAPPEMVGGTSDFTLFGSVVEDRQQAEAFAQAELDLRAAGEVTLRGVAAGSPRLRPGARVRVGDAAPEVSGTYVLTEVTHVMTGEGGYTAEITSEPPQPRRRRSATIAVLGHVSSVDDPEGFGRVQVVLPAYDQAETDWMQVIAPGAGKSKGVMALPNVGDTVLVLCPNENLAHGMVLGGLYGIQKPADAGVEGGKTKRFSVHTPGGHHLTLDDAKNVLRIEGSKGSYIEFAPSRVLLHAGANLDIEAPGKSVNIKGASIDFKTG